MPVMATLHLLPPLLLPPAAAALSEAVTDEVMEAASSASVAGFAKASTGTPLKVSAPATACVPGEAEAEGAVEGWRGSEDGEAPSAPHVASATSLQADVSTGSAPLQVRQAAHSAAPEALAKLTPKVQGVHSPEPAAAAEPGAHVEHAAAPAAAAVPAPHMLHSNGTPESPPVSATCT